MIQLRLFTPNDFAQLLSWTDSAEMLMQFAGPQLQFPLTTQQLDDMLADEQRICYAVEHTTTGNTIGHAQLNRIEENTILLCRLLIADKANRGKGLGTEMVQQLLQIAFGELQAKEATLNVFDWNTAAIRCYEKLGFTINPGKEKLREVNGKTWMAINMSVYRSSPSENIQ